MGCDRGRSRAAARPRGDSRAASSFPSALGPLSAFRIHPQHPPHSSTVTPHHQHNTRAPPPTQTAKAPTGLTAWQTKTAHRAHSPDTDAKVEVRLVLHWVVLLAWP